MRKPKKFIRFLTWLCLTVLFTGVMVLLFWRHVRLHVSSWVPGILSPFMLIWFWLPDGRGDAALKMPRESLTFSLNFPKDVNGNFIGKYRPSKVDLALYWVSQKGILIAAALMAPLIFLGSNAAKVCISPLLVLSTQLLIWLVDAKYTRDAKRRDRQKQQQQALELEEQIKRESLGKWK